MWTEAYHYTKWHLDPCSHLAILHGPKLWGSVPLPLFEGEYVRAGCPSNTMSPGPRSTSVPSGILIDPAVWPQQTWAENWGRLCHVPSNTMSPRPISTSLRSGCLIDPAVWPQQTWAKNWGLCPFGGLGPHLTKCDQRRGLPPYQVAS